MAVEIITRASKGSRLTAADMDGNLEALAGAITDLQTNGTGGGGGGTVGLPIGTTTDAIQEGTQNRYFTDARVRATGLNGLDTSDVQDVTASDSVASAIGKLQGKFSELPDTTRATPLDGFDTASAADVTAADTILSALGKLQAKWAQFTDSVRSTALNGLSTATNAAIAAADTVLVALGKLQAQINVRPTINAPKTDLTGAASLNAATHGNRELLYNGASATLTVQSDALGGWAADDEVIVVTDDASSGVPTLSFPGGTTLVGGPGVTIGGIRKGADKWQPYCLPRDVFGALKRGLVPAAGAVPSATKFLNEQGAWAVPAGGGGGAAVRWTGLEKSAAIIPHTGGNTSSNIGCATAPLDSSTSAIATVDTTSFLKMLQRLRYGGAAAAVSRMAGIWTNNITPFLTPHATTAGLGGFTARVQGAISDAISSGQFGIGFAVLAPAWTNAIEPSAMVNCIFLGGDSTDAQLSVMVNDASGTCTKIALNGGAGFPNNTSSTDVYSFEVTFNATGASRSIDYVAKNLTTGVTATGNVNTNIPGADLRLNAFFARGSANNALQPFVDIPGLTAGSFLL